MNTVYIEAETICVYNNFANRMVTLPLYGIENDEICDENAFSNSIKRIIAKAEEVFGGVIENVNIVCNIGNFSIQKHSRIKDFIKESGKSITNKFEMQTCNAFEVVDEKFLKKIINLFAELGVIVEKIYSPFGLFIQNAKEIITNQKIATINLHQCKTTAMFFDGAGSIIDFKTYDFGVSKCIEYITNVTVAHFPYLKQNTDALSLVLQDFINLSEVEMIDRINSNKKYKKEVIALVNYEMARFVSEKMYKYCIQMWEGMSVSKDVSKVYFVSNTKYAKTFLLIFNLIASQHVLPLNNFLKIEQEVKQKNSLWQEIKGLLKSA